MYIYIYIKGQVPRDGRRRAVHELPEDDAVRTTTTTTTTNDINSDNIDNDDNRFASTRDVLALCLSVVLDAEGIEVAHDYICMYIYICIERFI